jgi:hypothetical protein
VVDIPRERRALVDLDQPARGKIAASGIVVSGMKETTMDAPKTLWRRSRDHGSCDRHPRPPTTGEEFYQSPILR